MAETSAVVGYVILGVGGVLMLVALILIIIILNRRRKAKERAHSPDTFKVVYNMPMANGASTKMVSDAVDAKSTHTLVRSEPGYAYAAPPPPQSLPPPSPNIIPQPVLVRSPPVVPVNPIPRAVSLDHVNYVQNAATLPRAGYRYVYPAGNTSRVLIPISKKKAKKMQRRATPKPLYIPMYSSNVSNSRSVLSAPGYATSVRSVASGTGQRNKYYMYGSTPNLYAREYTQPVLMYDGKKKYFHADEITAGRNEHVENWLHHEHPVSHPVYGAEAGRPISRASSAPTDLDTRSVDTDHALHLRWSPRMARRLAEKDRHRTSSSQSYGYDVPPASPTPRVTPLHSYTEVSEVF